MTNVESAFLEHNIIVTSKYFRDIRIESLAKKVNMGPNELENLLQNMKSENKIDLSIDHRNRIILFKSSKKKCYFGVFNSFLDDQIINQSRRALMNFCSIMERI